MASPQQASRPASSMASKAEPNRSRTYDPKKPHITDEPITRANWYTHVNWLNVTLIVGIPIYGLIAAYWTPLQWKTAVWAVAYYFMTGMGITAGEFQAIVHLNADINNSGRLSQTLGTHLLLRPNTTQDLPRGHGRRCSRRFDPLVVPRSPRPSPLHRHRQRSLLRPQRSSLLTFRLDGHEAEPQTHWTHRHLGLE